MNVNNIIKSIDFFSLLDEKQIEYLVDISMVRSFSKDTIIYYESDIDYSLQFLVDGLIKIYKIDKHDNEIFLYYIYENNMISELTSIDSESIYCFSNASFVEDGAILSINFKKFKEYFLDTGILASKFIKEILQKSHQLQCIINRELVFDATAKVAHMIYSDLDMFNSLKKTQIAFMLHIQPETLSRVLKRFTRDNLIEVHEKKYIIKDDSALSSIFQGIGL
ncbi:MAG: Crp/Fnr family transcriptional regulator [Campylobacterota bacterium]|nr:Crp/Fnr family transcriptional regulator [Campylobacterota bacterium]